VEKKKRERRLNPDKKCFLCGKELRNAASHFCCREHRTEYEKSERAQARLKRQQAAYEAKEKEKADRRIARAARPKSVKHEGILREMFHEGKTLQEMGDALGMTRERARQLLKPLGLIARHRPSRAKPKAANCEWCGAAFTKTNNRQKYCSHAHAMKGVHQERPKTRTPLQASILEMWNRGMIARDIALELDTSTGNVNIKLHRMRAMGEDVKPHPKGGTFRARTNGRDEEVARLWQEGIPVKEIAAKFGVSSGAIRAIALRRRKAGDTRFTKREGGRKKTQ